MTQRRVRGKTLLGRPRLEPALASLLPDDASFEQVDASELLRGVRERVRDSADAKDVDVLIYCTCGRIWAKLRALSEALYQLIANAVTATRKGFPVVVDARESSGGDVLFHIQDTGTGMPARTLAGLGLPSRRGVALAWAAVEQHGGLLRFESAPGVGTTATVWLPGVAGSAPAR